MPAEIPSFSSAHKTANSLGLIALVLLVMVPASIGQTAKIMPLGDSITGGTNDFNWPNGSIPGGYRKVFLVEMNGGIVVTNPNPLLNFYQPGDGIHPGQAG
jgi:hypothetical protein